MSTFGLTWNLKSPDRNKQFISNIPRNSNVEIFVYILTGSKFFPNRVAPIFEKVSNIEATSGI